MVDSQYFLPNDVGVSALDCGEAFRLLSPQEKMYAHYMSRAAWWVWLLQVTISIKMANLKRRHTGCKRILFQVRWFGSAAADLSRVCRYFCLAAEDLQEADSCAAGTSCHSSWTESWGVPGKQLLPSFLLLHKELWLRNKYVCVVCRRSWCMPLVSMPTWETTSPLETPSSFQIFQR